MKSDLELRENHHCDEVHKHEMNDWEEETTLRPVEYYRVKNDEESLRHAQYKNVLNRLKLDYNAFKWSQDNMEESLRDKERLL